MTTPDVPLIDQLEAVSREVSHRERTYPDLVASGVMTQEKADHGIIVMRAVYATLLELFPTPTIF